MLPSAKSLEGKKLPSVTFKTRAKNQWKDVSTDEVFNGKTVIAFCLPGAYTPINPKAIVPEPVLIFAKSGCPHCARAKALLESNGLGYSEISLGKHITSSTLRAVSGSDTWPQVFIGGKLIGSADDLETYFGARKAA